MYSIRRILFVLLFANQLSIDTSVFFVIIERRWEKKLILLTEMNFKFVKTDYKEKNVIIIKCHRKLHEVWVIIKKQLFAQTLCTKNWFTSFGIKFLTLNSIKWLRAR